jgi:hypothetical protein
VAFLPFSPYVLFPRRVAILAFVVPEHMQVVEMTAAGGPEGLVAATRPVPQPRADQVLVQVTAAGVNGVA